MGQVKFAHRFFIFSHTLPFHEDDIPFYVGGSGFLIKYEKEYVFVTASHAVGMVDNVVNDRVLNSFLLMPNPTGGFKFVRLAEFVKPVMQGDQLECVDLGVFRINEDDYPFMVNYLDNSRPGMTIAADKFNKDDEMVLSGFPFIPNTEPVNFKDKTINYNALDIFLRYSNPEISSNLHMAVFDEEINKIFKVDSSVLNGISGSIVLLKRNDELVWAGMVLTAGSGRVRFIDANFIDQYIHQRVFKNFA